MRINAIAIGAILAMGGLMAFGYGLLYDPFLLPFPDYNLMPESQKVQYNQRHKNSTVVKNLGLGLIVLGGSCWGVGMIIKQTGQR